MTPAAPPLIVWRNENPMRADFPVKVDGVLVDMTAGYAAVMHVRGRRAAPGDPMVEVDSAAVSGSRIDFTATGFELIIYTADMAGIPADTVEGRPFEGVYEIVITEPGGDSGPWFTGEFVLNERVVL